MNKRCTFHPEYELTTKQLISITGVDRRTARRWVTGKQNIHTAYRKLIELEIENRILPAGCEVQVTADKKGIYLEFSKHIFDFHDLGRLRLDLQLVYCDRKKVRELEIKVKQLTISTLNNSKVDKLNSGWKTPIIEN